MSSTREYMFRSVCRLCLDTLQFESFYNLFEIPGLVKKLCICTSLSVEPQDGYPSNICGACYTRLNDLHDFQKQCIDSMQKFQEMLGSILDEEIDSTVLIPSGVEEQHKMVIKDEFNQFVPAANHEIATHSVDKIYKNFENLKKEPETERHIDISSVDKIEIEEPQVIVQDFNGIADSLVPPEKINNESSNIYESTSIGQRLQNNPSSRCMTTAAKNFACRYCSKLFTRKDSMEQHEKMHTGERPYKCDICGKGFVKSSALKYHEMTHTGEKPYKCITCGNGFKHPMHLKQHEMTHSGEKPYICNTCGKGFTQVYTLKFHEMTHTGEKPHKCETCGKGFRRVSELKFHEMTHTGEKPYKCNTCGNCFKLSTQLKDHEMTHTGEKPHKCETCGKAFVRYWGLKYHERRHTGEKPHKCEICGKGFIQSYDLKLHEMTHTGEKRYKCDTCGKGFSRISRLQNHYKKHTNQYTNETELENLDIPEGENAAETNIDSSDADQHEFIGAE